MSRGKAGGTDYVVTLPQSIRDSTSSFNAPNFQQPRIPQFYVWEAGDAEAPERFIFDDDKFDEAFPPCPEVEPFLESEDAVHSQVEQSTIDPEEISQLRAESSKSPLGRNKQVAGLRILLENVKQSYFTRDLNAAEVYSLKQNWHLPLDFVTLLSYRELNAGFAKKKLQMIENHQVIQITMCFLAGGILSLSHDLKASLTRGFWFSRDRDLLDAVLEDIISGTPHIRHPFFIPRQILHALTDDIENSANRVLSALGQVRGDIDNAVRNGYVDGFEYYFYRANKKYFHGIGDIWEKLDQAEALGKFILEGLSDLGEAITDSEQRIYFEEVVTFDMKRLQCFRRNIEMRDANIKRHLELLHNLINLRDGRVNKLIAETSAQVARESKRDSSASKALAVVATVFLPGTFIASLFATPFFNFSTPTGTKILSHQFWIYWAVSIPLTIIVVLLWFIWYRYTSEKNRIEDEKGDSATNQSIFAYNFDREVDPPLLVVKKKWSRAPPPPVSRFGRRTNLFSGWRAAIPRRRRRSRVFSENEI